MASTVPSTSISWPSSSTGSTRSRVASSPRRSTRSRPASSVPPSRTRTRGPAPSRARRRRGHKRQGRWRREVVASATRRVWCSTGTVPRAPFPTLLIFIKLLGEKKKSKNFRNSITKTVVFFCLAFLSFFVQNIAV